MSSVLCATAESRISNEYTAPLWTWTQRDRRHLVASLHHRITHHRCIILQTHFLASAVASSWEFVDICDALEISVLDPVIFYSFLLSTFHYFFSTPATIPHVPLLMPFLFSACFPSSHDRCISHPLRILRF